MCDACYYQDVIERIVKVLGCGGDDKYVAAFDPDQDNDREALEIARKALEEA